MTCTDRRGRGAPPGGGRARGSLRCPRCRMHVPLCLCEALPRIGTETEVRLLFGRDERDKTTNTGRLLDLCLSECGPWDPEADAPDRRTYVLFPDPEAPVLDAAFAHLDPRPLTLVVPDGRWTPARRLVRKQLAHLPRLNLPDGPPTRFRLRKPPQPHHLCTLEAVARALGVIEGHHVEAALRDVLERMVDRTLYSRGMLPAAEVYGGLGPRG